MYVYMVPDWRMATAGYIVWYCVQAGRQRVDFTQAEWSIEVNVEIRVDIAEKRVEDTKG